MDDRGPGVGNEAKIARLIQERLGLGVGRPSRWFERELLIRGQLTFDGVGIKPFQLSGQRLAFADQALDALDKLGMVGGVEQIHVIDFRAFNVVGEDKSAGARACG